MTISALYKDFFDFWEAAQGRPLGEKEALWNRLYVQPNADIFALYDREHGSTQPLETTFARYERVIHKLRSVASRVEDTLTETTRLCALQLTGDVQGRHIVMVGRFTSNAWADLFKGTPTCFYALELIPTVEAFAVMVAHEMTHLIHRQLCDLPFEGLTVAEKLLVEGLATLSSASAVRGLSDGGYLWPGWEETTEGQDVRAWLAECSAREGTLRRQLLADLDERDPATLGRYFNTGEKYRHRETPVRAGYFMGYRLRRLLSKEHT